MSETPAPPHLSWLRWGVIAAILVAGLVLFLLLAPESRPLVPLGDKGGAP